ncbi:unnamed protein product [Kuraishia capsulata CBS 1993]|uniref:Transcription factor domain-containing protein n=1 Tax=Kuraishia capsulata CBS 1993 TaxID=1382522 RepID=W6MI64_9ASCO|nr:uncharacterized protein KUCA_T00002080001 [Kuraishia capsulata CBS 1993]CDK26109.1 unnamed protein product [Kuraishia capsulata CBS 1993]
MEGFLPSISSQYTVAELLPAGLAIPMLMVSSAFREVCFTCGASYLIWKNPSMVSVADRRYLRCLRILFQEINSQNVDGSEDWLLFGILNLSLREKYYGASNTKCTMHLTAAYQLLRQRQWKWLNIQKSQPKFDKIKFENFINPDSDDLDANNFVIFNRELSDLFSSSPKTQIKVTPNERYMIDSFAYNYAAELLVCKDDALAKLPSPFDFFDDFREAMSVALFPLPLDWMNNPILGAARDAYELAAKASYVSRFTRLEGIMLEKAQELYKQASSSLCSNLPSFIYDSESKATCTHLRSSLMVGEIVMRSCHILLRKTLNRSINSDDEVIQRDVRIVIECLKLIPEYHNISCIMPWPVTVAASAAIHPTDQAFFQRRTLAIGDQLHTRYAYQMLDLYAKAWGTGKKKPMGCDVLLDRELLEKVCF